MSDRTARVALTRLAEPGYARVTSLVTELGAEAVLRLLEEQRRVQGVYSDAAARMFDLDPDRELRDAAARGIRFVTPSDDEWPPALDALALADPNGDVGGVPIGLWVRGELRLDEATARAVAIVGSRTSTTYGVGVASGMAAELVQAGYCVVSGAAIGIDAAAHRGALGARGTTVAVLACGVDRVYPAQHRDLLKYVVETGLIVSELPPGCSPTRPRFLARNRVIAALAQGTVVVEAAIRSGALSTSTWAGRLSRPVMGVPGAVTSAPSEGVHELLRSGEGTLVTRASDVLELVAPAGEAMVSPRRATPTARDRLTSRDKQILDAVPVVDAAPVPSIARTSGISAVEVTDALRRLQRGGFVESNGVGWRVVRAGSA